MWEEAQGFCNEFDIFLVTGDDECMEDFLTLFPDVKVVRGFLVLDSTKDSAVSYKQDKVDETEHDQS